MYVKLHYSAQQDCLAQRAQRAQRAQQHRGQGGVVTQQIRSTAAQQGLPRAVVLRRLQLCSEPLPNAWLPHRLSFYSSAQIHSGHTAVRSPLLYHPNPSQTMSSKSVELKQVKAVPYLIPDEENPGEFLQAYCFQTIYVYPGNAGKTRTVTLRRKVSQLSTETEPIIAFLDVSQEMLSLEMVYDPISGVVPGKYWKRIRAIPTDLSAAVRVMRALAKPVPCIPTGKGNRIAGDRR